MLRRRSGLKKYFGRQRPAGARRRRRQLRRSRTGETLGLVGESGSGKSTIGRTRAEADRAERRRESVFEGVDLAPLSARAMRPLPAAPADHLPGSVREPQPAAARRRHARRGAGHARPAPGPARASAHRRAARAGRPRARARAPLSARILRRAAPAHRHRPRARGRAASSSSPTSRSRRSTCRSRRR